MRRTGEHRADVDPAVGQQGRAKGNPVGTTDVMMNYIYTRAFNYFEFGYAAACGLMMGVFVFTTSMFLKRYLRYGQDQ